MIATASVLKVIDPNQPFMVETNASDFAVRAILIRNGRSITFESKNLEPSHIKYRVYEKELFSISHALKTWHHYLYILPHSKAIL